MEKILSLPKIIEIQTQVQSALREDIGSGDITAALIPFSSVAEATVISREQAIISGSAWVNQVFEQLDPAVKIEWNVVDGQSVAANEVLFSLSGSVRSLLTGERTALNFLQMMSGTATICRRYADLVNNTKVKLLDTRKTIPGLRTAQKYAVVCGGCYNHRMGLYDAFLIKENHIAACGSIELAIAAARKYCMDKTVEIEVESLKELEQAIKAGSDIIMLDNFSIENLHDAVKLTSGKAQLEASGNVTHNTLQAIAETGVDYISIGALTKDCKAIDLSMRIN